MKNLNELIKKIIPQAISTPQPTNNTMNHYNQDYTDDFQGLDDSSPFDQNEDSGSIPVTEYRSLGTGDNQPEKYEIQLDDMIIWLNQKGTQLYGPLFKILPADYEVIFKLLVYFFRDKTNAPKYNLDFNKGLLVSGPVGCGKTTLLNLFRIMVASHSGFQMLSCRDISHQFMDQGFTAIKYYCGTDQKKPSVFCFDDLGTETSMKYFGNETNVMAEILLSRYDLLINRKIQTHITTNLSASELEAAYGNRVRSRMRQMFNLIAFETDAVDKRK
ncbi:MAG: AAA family ATPase [Daejeonella sp.]